MILEITIGVFGFILTILGTLLLSYFKEMKSDVKNMSQSIFQLNMKLERVISDQSWHKDEIVEMKERIHAIEKRNCEENYRS